jgi:hypothetical protein
MASSVPGDARIAIEIVAAILAQSEDRVAIRDSKQNLVSLYSIEH